MLVVEVVITITAGLNKSALMFLNANTSVKFGFWV